MSNRAIIAATKPLDLTITLQQFEDAAEDWGPHATLGPDVDFEADAVILVERPGEAAFQIFHPMGEDMILTAGTAQQIAEVAVWTVESFPLSGPSQLWLTDEEYTGHTVLRPGMSVDEVWSAWETHA